MLVERLVFSKNFRHSEKTENQVTNVDFRLIQNLIYSIHDAGVEPPTYNSILLKIFIKKNR